MQHKTIKALTLAIIKISGIPVKIATPIATWLLLLGPIDDVACRVLVSIAVVVVAIVNLWETVVSSAFIIVAAVTDLSCYACSDN